MTFPSIPSTAPTEGRLRSLHAGGCPGDPSGVPDSASGTPDSAGRSSCVFVHLPLAHTLPAERDMSKARPVIPGATVFSTRRIHKRQLLLRPSPRVNQIILYIVAVLAKRHNIKLHALCAMSNHKHDVSTDPDGSIVDFQRDWHSVMGRHINAVFGDFESPWAREETSRVDCVSPGDVIAKIAYTMSNPVEAFLVQHGHHWPGVRLAWPAKSKTIARPRGFFRTAEEGGEWPDEVTLEFHRPPGFEHLDDDELAALIATACQEREDRFRAVARQENRRFLGRRAVLAQSRYAYPCSSEKRFSLRPTVAARSKWARIERLHQNRAWDTEYAAARRAFCAGDRNVLFPYGTFKLKRYYRVSCRPPPVAA